MRSSPHILFAVLWIAAEVVLLFQDRAMAWVALGFFAFLLILWLITRRLVHEPTSTVSDVLKAAGTRKRLFVRAVIVAAVLLLIFIYGFTNSKVLTVPVFDSAYRGIARLAPQLGSGLPNFVLYVLIPGLLVVALGARRRELGLTRPAKGTYLATLVGGGLFLLSWVWRILQRRMAIPMLGLFLLHNFLSNGFSEEFLTKGLVLSHLRAFMRNDWALVVQAMIFAFLHFGSSLHDERTMVGVVANVIALNAPMGYFLGLMAVRTRSLFLPAAVHLIFDTTRNVWM